MKIKLSAIHKRAEVAADGYADDCLRLGTIDGEWLHMEPKDWVWIKTKYAGLGDAAAAVAQPIAKVIDAVLGTKFRNCKGCRDRQKRLNSLTSGR